MEFAETISFEKRQRVVDREKFTAQVPCRAPLVLATSGASGKEGREGRAGTLTITSSPAHRTPHTTHHTPQMRMAVARTRGEGVGIQKEVKTYEEYAGPVQDTYAGVVRAPGCPASSSLPGTLTPFPPSSNRVFFVGLGNQFMGLGPIFAGLGRRVQVENTLELLKGWSLDERAHRLKDETTLHHTKVRAPGRWRGGLCVQLYVCDSTHERRRHVVMECG